MLCIFNNNNDIYFNLASEEYLLKHKVQNIMMLWISAPCVVVGKHQNTFAEINNKYINRNKIQVARRLSGGGSVYHDSGNLNYTFIINGQTGKLVDFKRFIHPIIDYLSSVGLVAEMGSKNDLLANGLKISGNAEHIHKNRVLHHGTLLFHTDLAALKESLDIVPGRFIDKAVQSNRTSVTNIRGLMNHEITFDEFGKGLFTFLMLRNYESVGYQFNKTDINAIKKLRDEKYIQWDWIYGYSPPFSLYFCLEINNNTYNYKLFVEKGQFVKVEADEYLRDNLIAEFLDSMLGESYQFQVIEKRIKDSQLDENIKQQLLKVLL